MPKLPSIIDRRGDALFLDVDGTLLEIEQHPADVHADAPLIELLERLFVHLDGAMALISGRSIEDIDRIFGGARFPAAGAHGAELRTGRDAAQTVPAQSLPAAVVDRIAEFADEHDGLLLERKLGGVSLHYRRAPDLEAACRALILPLMATIEADFRLIEGKMVLEIAPRQHDKGESIRELLALPPFAGRRPVFVGDDVTDEDGFRVVNEVGGVSIRVGSESPSLASLRLDDVAAVRAWLRGLLRKPNAATG